MLIGRHLEADDLARASTSMITRWSMATCWSPGSGYFHASSVGMTDLRLDEVHVADVPLVLLEGRDLLRVGRPDQDRPVALRPAGVVGGVAEVLHAVGGERPFRAGRDVADPQVPVLDVGRARAIGRLDVIGRRRRVGPARAASTPAARSRALRERARTVRAGCRVHQHGLRALLGGDPVPDLVVGQPRRLQPTSGRPAAPRWQPETSPRAHNPPSSTPAGHRRCAAAPRAATHSAQRRPGTRTYACDEPPRGSMPRAAGRGLRGQRGGSIAGRGDADSRENPNAEPTPRTPNHEPDAMIFFAPTVIEGARHASTGVVRCAHQRALASWRISRSVSRKRPPAPAHQRSIA